MLKKLLVLGLSALFIIGSMNIIKRGTKVPLFFYAYIIRESLYLFYGDCDASSCARPL